MRFYLVLVMTNIVWAMFYLYQQNPMEFHLLPIFLLIQTGNSKIYLAGFLINFFISFMTSFESILLTD